MATSNMPEPSLLSKTPKLPFKKRRKQLERDIEHVTSEMYKRNKELAETNKLLSLLRTIDILVLESQASVQVVCEHITQAISEATDYPFVGLFTRSLHSKDHLTLFGWSGKDLVGAELKIAFSKPLHLQLTNPWLQAPLHSELIALEEMAASDIAASLGSAETDIAKLIEQTSLQSLYSIKLFVRRRLVGVLVVGFPIPKPEINQTDTLLIDRLSETIGVALDNKLLFEENQHVLRQLRESNDKLLALDETKDEFISMASHQLRTPLTSVKGYLSMVIEGDAGQVTDKQRKLLNQAFTSSQRMVYLIADLLNVSRLRTGKLVMQSSPTDLAEVVKGEVEQLSETAKLKNLTLTYKKSATFPMLLLDETKLRQVIMNLIDNAIYYTPSGGTIAVELKSDKANVYFTVKDTGLGVPKSEQSHMFSKFYRAKNAQRARPDGTGLGLFMAKKVINAQGGTMLFESVENKGSTFGFCFETAKLLAKKSGSPG